MRARYGAGSIFTQKIVSNGVSCSNEVFGDPLIGIFKSCQIAPPVWSRCAEENDRCEFSGTKLVRYGADGIFVTQTQTNGVDCNNSVFGDPLVAVYKFCEVTDLEEGFVMPVPTPAATPSPTPVPKQKFAIGVYEGSANFDKVKSYETFLGRQMDYINDTVPSENWDHMVGDGLYWYFAGSWRASGLDRVVITIPMIPTFAKYDGPSLSDAEASQALIDGANGAYDQQWIKMRKTLIAAGFTKNFIRLGWEMNGNWYNWRANVNPTAWVKYWRRIVGILKDDPVVKFQFVWNPTLADQAIAAELVYPGDDLVDVIGLDVYDSDWSRYPAGSNNLEVQKEVWEKTIKNGPHGLTFYSNFARSHGKPIHIDEWGVGDPDGHMGGDNPYFVQALFDWSRDITNNVTLMMYYDDPQLLPPTNFPKSSELLKKLIREL